jgi:hypothetical protein
MISILYKKLSEFLLFKISLQNMLKLKNTNFHLYFFILTFLFKYFKKGPYMLYQMILSQKLIFNLNDNI